MKKNKITIVYKVESEDGIVLEYTEDTMIQLVADGGKWIEGSDGVRASIVEIGTGDSIDNYHEVEA